MFAETKMRTEDARERESREWHRAFDDMLRAQRFMHKMMATVYVTPPHMNGLITNLQFHADEVTYTLDNNPGKTDDEP